jgi:hypothetical protein
VNHSGALEISVQMKTVIQTSQVAKLLVAQNGLAAVRMYQNTGLLKMIVRVLTTCHTQYT